MDDWLKFLLCFFWAVIAIFFIVFQFEINSQEYAIECIKNWWVMVNEILPWSATNDIYCTKK